MDEPVTRPCSAKYVSPSDGYEFSCDREHGHKGLHKAEDYDIDKDCFREAEWL